MVQQMQGHCQWQPVDYYRVQKKGLGFHTSALGDPAHLQRTSCFQSTTIHPCSRSAQLAPLMATFSWSDSIHAAFGPCLACLNTKRDHDEDGQAHGPYFIPRARPDELEGLLVDSDDAETLSLHSNVGNRDARRRARRTRSSHNGIKLFGFYLFGRPPIHLPDDDDDDGEADHGGVRSGRQRGERARTISASTLDSDASPLDPSTIDELTAARVAAQIAQQREAARLAKEERRRQRRERREAQRAALALALSTAEGDEFEGFQVCLLLDILAADMFY